MNSTQNAPHTEWVEHYPSAAVSYDAQVAERMFSFNPFHRPWKQISRFWQRFFFVIGFILQFWYFTWLEGQIWTYLGAEDIEWAQSQRRRKHARWLTESLLTLGPTFIKVGQSISTRVDLIRKEYIEELSKLQDRVPPFPFETVQQLIQSELDEPLENIFEYIEAKPLAAASLGQVHVARLKMPLDGIQHGMQDVVIKVQRQNLVELFWMDLAILRRVAQFFQSNTEMGRVREWVQIVDEFGKTLFEEIDYIQEGRHADIFRENFRENPNIHVPVVFWEYTTRRIITYEYAPGIKINDIRQLELKGFNREFIAETAVKCFFQQILLDGFYHADPHPGNIAIGEDGKIIFYDYGMVGRLPEKTRTIIVEAFLNIINKKPDHILNNLLELDMIAPSADLEVIRQLIEWALDNYYDIPHEQLNFEYLTDELSELMYAHPFKLPANFTFMIRSLITLEGVATHLHPGVQFMSIAVDYARGYLTESGGIQFLIKKGRELLGGVGLVPMVGGSRKNQQRVRLAVDEWLPLGRYVKGAATLLAVGQVVQFVALLFLLRPSHLEWISSGVTVFGVLSLGLMTVAILALFPAYRKPVRFTLGKTHKS